MRAVLAESRPGYRGAKKQSDVCRTVWFLVHVSPLDNHSRISYNLDTMKDTNMTKIIGATLGIIIVILGVYFLYARLPESSNNTTGEEENGEFQEAVDRGISDEDWTRFDERIAGLVADIEEREASGNRDISLHLQLGNAYYMTGQLSLAIEQYDNILSTHPNDAAALENKGQVLLEAGDPAGAEVAWRKAISVGAQESVYFSLTKLIRDEFPDRTDDIRTILEEGIATLGQTQGFMVDLGNWYHEEGMLDEAISHYEVAWQLSGNNEAIKAVLDDLRKERADQEK